MLYIQQVLDILASYGLGNFSNIFGWLILALSFDHYIGISRSCSDQLCVLLKLAMFKH